MFANQITFADSVNNVFAVVKGAAWETEAEARAQYERVRKDEVADSSLMLDLIIGEDLADSFCISLETAGQLVGYEITHEVLLAASAKAKQDEAEALAEFEAKRDAAA